jgi:hypothetical protein
MASLDVIRRITLRAESEGFEDLARNFQSLGRAEEGLVATSERTERATGRVEQSFRRIQSSLDPAARAVQQFERDYKGIRAAQEQGLTTQARGNELIELAEKRAIAAATATERFADAHKGLSAQSQAALHSIRSVAEQVALGISPVQALTGQMNHLSFAATGEGGLKGAFAGLGPVLSGALRFVNPLTIGLAAVGGAALAANRALDQQHEARVATTAGLGRLGQTTPADVGAIASRAAGNGVSIGQAREAVLNFARAGVESNEVIERGTKLVQRYAVTVGGEFADAQKELAGLAAEPGKGIEAVAKKVGIDADITNRVKLLDSLGDKNRAATESFDALDKALVRDADASTAAGRAKAFLFSQATKVADFVGGIATGQPRDTAAAQRAAQQALAAGTNLRPGFEGQPIRGVPGVLPEAGIDEMQATATAKALDEVSRSAKRRELVQKGVNEEIRKGTEAHQLDLAAIHAHTAEEQAGVAMTRTYLAAVEQTKNDEVARAAATEAGEKVLAQHNQQQEDAVRIGKANVDVIRALGGEQVKAAAAAQVLAVRADDYAGAQAKVNDITAQQEVAERNRTLQHQANLQSISAVTQSQAEAAAGQQAYTAALIGGATAAQANKAASQAMAEEQAKDVAAAHQIGRAHDANMKAIVALTTEEKANAAADVAAAGQREGSWAAAQASVAAYREEIAKANVVQRDFNRNFETAYANAGRSAQASLAAAQLPIGPGRQRAAGQIEAEAGARNQVATIQAQNPNIMIDTGAVVSAAKAIADIGETARQADTSLQMVANWGTQAANLNVATAKLTGGMDAAAAAAQTVINSGMAQINAQGLEGAARERAVGALNDVAGAAARQAEAADLVSRNHEALARDAQMAAQGISQLGVSLKNIVHDTTISAQDAAGKTLGSGVTLTGLLTQEGYWRAKLAEDATKQLEVLNTSSANDNLLQSQKGLQSQAMAVASPLSSLVEQAQSSLDSARDEVKSAQQSAADATKNAQAQPMANATQADPRLDPYLSRNASVYYGSATQQFYKEISWQEASLSTAKESASIDQEALQTAQQHLSVAEQQYNTLQSLADSENRKAASGMTPQALGAELANALKAAGYAKTAADVASAADSYSDAKKSLDLQVEKASLENTIAYAKNLAVPPIPTFTGSTFNTATPFTPLQDVALKPHATGADLILPGSGGEQPYMVSAQPGERLRISPRGDSGGAYQDNRTITTNVYGVTQPEAVAARLEQDEKSRRGYSSAAVRAARLAA